MALTAPASTGTPVHEPVHGRAGTTATEATDRDREARGRPGRRTRLDLSRACRSPRPEVPRHILYSYSGELDALTVRTLPARSPRPAGQPPRTWQS
jgi:hypothetical protein